MTKKLLTLLLAVAASVGTVFAWNYKRVKIGGLYYNLDATNQTAEVTYSSYTDNEGWGIYIYNEGWGITTANIPASVTYNSVSYIVTSIGNWAFAYCSGLTSIEIPNSVTSIGDYAFEGCSGLTTVTINSNTILSKNYSNSNNMKNIFRSQVTKYIIGNSVTSIGDYAFEGCSGLTSVTIPNSVTSIGDQAFVYCTGLTSVTIPNSVTSIGNWAFDYCSGLTFVTIGNSVTSIGSGAFYNCTGLTSVTIGNSVTSIGKYAFYNCSSLTSVTIPNSVTSIGDDAFEKCNKLKELQYYYGLDISSANIPSTTKLIVLNNLNKFPPLLTIVDNTLSFSDASNNNRIDADEKSSIRFKVRNNGKGSSLNCEARITMTGTTSGINANSVKLPNIGVGETYEINIPITSNFNTQNGNVTFSIEVYEPNGWGVAPFDLTVATKAYEAPFLQVVDYNISSISGKIRKMEPFTLTFNLQNTQYGDAENVHVKVNLPANVFVMDGNAELSYPLIKSGEVKSIQITLAANNNYAITNIPITIDIKERHGKFAENKSLDIALNQTASSSIKIAAKDEPQQERKEIQKAMLTSDVDRNIPTTGVNNPNTFVLIIANEHYQQVAGVPYALNDGNIFREYCIKTLGIGEKHIKYLGDATFNQLKSGVNWLSNLTEAFDNPQMIIYYAGHGIPDEANRSAYILPVDGVGSDISTAYKLDELYSTLGDMPASRIVVFMDACFSGSKREQGMLVAARSVALKVHSGEPKGNMVVFSAAQGDETAYPDSEQQHGLFTYYLLKKLQETQGDITLKALGDYITKEVSRQSLIVNSKKQTPTVTASYTLGSDWQLWTLK